MNFEAKVGLSVLLVWVLIVIGCISNIIQVVMMIDSGISALFVLKCIGIVVAPLGAVLGWIGFF